MVRAELLRRMGAVAALLGIGCLLVALILPWTHEEPPPGIVGIAPEDDALLGLLIISFSVRSGVAAAIFILYLLPLLGACLVAVDGRRAWQGIGATLLGSALLLLGTGCALCGLITSHLLVGISMPTDFVPRPLYSAGPAVGLAWLGYGAVVVGGVLLGVGALLHRWTLRRTDRRASATTTG